jgi:hypothetical protein
VEAIAVSLNLEPETIYGILNNCSFVKVLFAEFKITTWQLRERLL